VKKRGKRPASTKTVRKQKVSVFFGFHPAGIKPSARSFNVMREDISLLLKTGKSKHGEWIHKGERLPGRNSMPALPQELVDSTNFQPIFAELEVEDDLTDGCAGQFDGKDNYHQVAEWPTKVRAAPPSTLHLPLLSPSLLLRVLGRFHSASGSSPAPMSVASQP
jgi:hypothetical protein